MISQWLTYNHFIEKQVQYNQIGNKIVMVDGWSSRTYSKL